MGKAKVRNVNNVVALVVEVCFNGLYDRRDQVLNWVFTVQVTYRIKWIHSTNRGIWTHTHTHTHTHGWIKWQCTFQSVPIQWSCPRWILDSADTSMWAFHRKLHKYMWDLARFHTNVILNQWKLHLSQKNAWLFSSHLTLTDSIIISVGEWCKAVWVNCPVLWIQNVRLYELCFIAWLYNFQVHFVWWGFFVTWLVFLGNYLE